MEKKIKPSDRPLVAKIIYGAVISILVITAVVVGIVSAASKDKGSGVDTPDPDGSVTDGGSTDTAPDDGKEEETPKPLSFVSPVVGTLAKEHSTTVPVYSTTLGEWRMHTGIDISAEVGASVYASEAGVISGIYSDPLLGYTVEITHRDNLKTRYSNLAGDTAGTLKVGDSIKSGDKIGTVGDSSVSELAEESHLHFEVILGGARVNPLDYITRESQESSLGIRK